MFKILFCILSITPIEPNVENLLEISSNYRQVSKSLSLVKESEIISRIPCIPPLCAKDLRHLSVNSGYGKRLHPILNEYKHHSGIDLPAKPGERVYVTADGVVRSVAFDAITGNYIKIAHDYGFETIYGHLSRQLTQQGDTVRIGTVIGLAGSTGRSTGPHLHYGITKNNKQQDPLPYCYLYMDWLATHSSDTICIHE